jgi:hypothetical protein
MAKPGPVDPDDLAKKTFYITMGGVVLYFAVAAIYALFGEV